MGSTNLIRSKFSYLRPHVIFWVLYEAYEIALSYSYRGTLSAWYDYLAYFMINVAVFYVHAYNVEVNMREGRRRYVRIILFTLLEMVGYNLVKYVIVALYVRIGYYKPAELSSLFIIVRDGSWRALYFIGLGTAYAFGRLAIDSAKRISELDKQRLQSQLNEQMLEKNLLTSEVAFLKAQINQHFLFNMLSFIHSNVMKYSEKISDLIISLSDLMRYAFSEPDADGKARLSAEVEHIENYLSLNQHRFDHKLNFDFRVSGNVNNVRVISLLLVTIIENVFKYGDLQNPDHPAKIYINVEGNKLHLHVDNAKLKRPHAHSSGIGMGNVQKRLDLMYPGDYQLKITQDTQNYQLDLNINIPANDLLHY